MERWVAWLRTLAPASPVWAALDDHSLTLAAIALGFITISSLILSLEAVIPGNRLSNLSIGAVVAEDIRAPHSINYVSQELTRRARTAASNNVDPIYDAPGPSVARQQILLGQQVLTYVADVRLDPYGTHTQKLADLQAISVLPVEPNVADIILELADEQWRTVETEVLTVLERVMREPIREVDIEAVRDQLPMQVSVRFDSKSALIVVSLLEGLVRPNEYINPTLTEEARRAAVASTPEETRSFAQGQIVVRGGTQVDALDYEALQALGLLQTPGGLGRILVRSLLASTVVALGVGLYIVRFQPGLRRQTSFLWLLVALFAIALLGAQIFTVSDQFYLFPAAALALLLVTIAPVEIAIVAGLALALFYGLLTGSSLEAAAMAAFGSLAGAVSLRRSERVDTFFTAGLVVAVVNMAILCLFNFDALAAGGTAQFGAFAIFSLINGVFAAAAALAGLYLVTLLFNLPTSLKLVDLSQPNQPLLQRLLREAPGTYQHSLQVANLSEQAATAIDANSQLVRVAALYHDIGKMLNPAFFIENQVEGVNPHESLNDPYRSASIIIAHVIDGDRLARQYRLPMRIRDFILEHHGTTLVGFFHRQALDQHRTADAIDEDAFRYPGPRPRSRETGIVMLADSCESTVRARKPANRQQIADIIEEIFDLRIRDRQLDDCNLTSRDLKTIRAIFIEMLQAVFHPRINYPSQGSVRQPITDTIRAGDEIQSSTGAANNEGVPPASASAAASADASITGLPSVAADEEPLRDVPPLRRVSKTPPGLQTIIAGSKAQPQNEHPEQKSDDL